MSKARVVSVLLAGSVAASALVYAGDAASAAGLLVGSQAGRSSFVHLCGVVDADRVVAPVVSSSGSLGVASVVDGVNPATLWQRGRLYVVDGASRRVLVFEGGRSLVGSVSVGFDVAGFAVDPDGSLYLLRGAYDVVKLSATGVTVWEKRLSSPFQSAFGLSTAAGWRLGVVTNAGTQVFDGSGVSKGSASVTGTHFSESNGTLVATDGRYVRVYDSGLKLVQVFGDRGFQNDPMPVGGARHFVQQGSAVRLPDGRFLVADGGRGIELIDGDGSYLGMVSQDALGGLTQSPHMAFDGAGTLYFAAGPKFVRAGQSVYRVAVDALVREALRPSSESPRLGYGAGISVVGAAGKLFKTGQAPAVRATFDAWWKSAGEVTLEYRARDREQILADTDVAFTRVPVTAALIDSGFALELPQAQPGHYEVEAFVVRGGKRTSGTCVTYEVAAADHQLDLAALPGSGDAGGPDSARGVALADILGTGAFRDGLSWEELMPQGASSSAPLQFGRYDARFAAGAAESAKRGVPFIVQLGHGGLEKQLVANGTWEARVREVVAHYKGQVHYWEAWNEPNITYGSAPDYVNKVLKPVHRVVKSVDPSAKVLGSSAVGSNLEEWWWWLADAGGFGAMDIVGIHPYTGHNRSFEEEGMGSSSPPSSGSWPRRARRASRSGPPSTRGGPTAR